MSTSGVMKRSRLLICLAAGLLAGGIVAGLWRASSPKYDLPAEYVPDAKAAHRWLASVPVIPASNTDAVAAEVRDAEPVPNQVDTFEPTPEMKDSLARLIADWLDYRARADVDGYAAWMRSRGYTLALKDLDAPRHYSMLDLDIKNAWRVYTGSEAPERVSDIDPEEFFRVAFARSLEEKSGYLRGERVSTRMQVLYQSIPITRPDTRPGGLGDWPEGDLWVGYSVAGDRPHWRPPITYEEVLQRDRVALVAMVFVATQAQSGAWLPMCISCYYDMATGEWHIVSATYSNSLYGGFAIER